MATPNSSAVCSSSHQLVPTIVCIGCQRCFCVQHFQEHKQQLSALFDNVILKSHAELVDQIQTLEESNFSPSHLYAQIEEWKKKTIEKVEKAAENAERELTNQIKKYKTNMTTQLELITKEIRNHRETENFCENEIGELRRKLAKLQEELEKYTQENTTKSIVVANNTFDWNQMIYIREGQYNSRLLQNIPVDATTNWLQNGIIVAGGNGNGNATHQLNLPMGLCIGDDLTNYIADLSNHRILEWKYGAMSGRVVAGGYGAGNDINQLRDPFDVIIDKDGNNLIIADYGNKRVVQWPLHNGREGKVIVSDVKCAGLAIDDNGYLYVADCGKHEVKRYRIGENEGTVVAGGNGAGSRLDQFNRPRCIFVDKDDSVYVSDMDNHRVMKWTKGAKKGIIVAGGKSEGKSLKKLNTPAFIFVDASGTLYVADQGNHRIIQWSKGATQGRILIDGSGKASQSNHFRNPYGFTFDRQGNIYVSDKDNHRVQMFIRDRNVSIWSAAFARKP